MDITLIKKAADPLVKAASPLFSGDAETARLRRALLRDFGRAMVDGIDSDGWCKVRDTDYEPAVLACERAIQELMFISPDDARRLTEFRRRLDCCPSDCCPSDYPRLREDVIEYVADQHRTGAKRVVHRVRKHARTWADRAKARFHSLSSGEPPAPPALP